MMCVKSISRQLLQIGDTMGDGSFQMIIQIVYLFIMGIMIGATSVRAGTRLFLWMY